MIVTVFTALLTVASAPVGSALPEPVGETVATPTPVGVAGEPGDPAESAELVQEIQEIQEIQEEVQAGEDGEATAETVITVPSAGDPGGAGLSEPPPPSRIARELVMDPLPPPPTPASRDRIRKGPWRGRWWVGLRVGVTGPIGGERPARPTLGSLSGGADFGLRINNWLGLATGITGQLHDRVTLSENTPYGVEEEILYGDMIFWDPLFARLYLPLKRRFQPFAEIGGGLAAYDRPEGGYILGGQIRSGIGFEGWVSSNITLGLIGNYRWTRLRQRFADGSDLRPVGHSYQVLAEVGFHW